MPAEKLEKRVAALEAEVTRLREELENSIPARETPENSVPWWRKIAGTFEGDPIFAEAMRLGRKYRESLRPKPRKPKNKSKK